MNNYSAPVPYNGYSNGIQPNKEKTSEVNAVKIELINPQAYGNAPQETAMSHPNQFQSMYAYPQTPIYPASYEMSEGPVYFMNQEQKAVPFIPQQPLANKNKSSEKTPPPKAPAENFSPIQNPVKKEIPTALVDQNSKPSAAQETNKTAKTKEEKNKIDIKPIIGSLKSDNMEQQFFAIQQIAEIGQNPKISPDLLLNDEIFKGLSNIITKNTGNMAGPTAEQKELREKKFSGVQLTSKENDIAETLAPQEIAEMNKQFATYALAVVQKNFRTSVNKEAEKQGLEKVRFNEIPEIDTVIENIKSNPNPLIREAGISALSYISKPEDKESLGIIFSIAAQDEDPTVREAAKKAQEKLTK